MGVRLGRTVSRRTDDRVGVRVLPHRPRGVLQTAPRFTASLGELDDLARQQLISALAAMPGAPVGVVVPAVARIIAALRSGADPLEIDVSDVAQAERDDVETVLRNAADNITGHAASITARALSRDWAQFASSTQQHDEPRHLREAERSALLHGERPL